MAREGKEIMIEGEPYVDSNAVDILLGGLLSDNAIRELGKTWDRQKVGNRWFYRKAAVKLPEYPLARWQEMTLMYMSLIEPDSEAMNYAEGGYYYAKAFINGAGLELMTTGTLTCSFGVVVFVLLASSNHYHFVVSDKTNIAGRVLKPGEIGQTTWGDAQVLSPAPLIKAAEAMLAPGKFTEAA